MALFFYLRPPSCTQLLLDKKLQQRAGGGTLHLGKSHNDISIFHNVRFESSMMVRDEIPSEAAECELRVSPSKSTASKVFSEESQR
jgi:hypothetical protein